MKLCDVPHCGYPRASAMGYCDAHARRVDQTGDPGADRPITRRVGLPAEQAIEAVRTCTTCGYTGPSETFPPDARCRGGRRRTCRDCASARYRRHYRRKTGWTDERVAAALAEQDGRCAICSTPIDERTARADHDHVLNQPRGLLCDGCNKGLGHLADNVDRLAAAITYLNHHNTRNGGRLS